MPIYHMLIVCLTDVSCTAKAVNSAGHDCPETGYHVAVPFKGPCHAFLARLFFKYSIRPKHKHVILLIVWLFGLSRNGWTE